MLKRSERILSRRSIRSEAFHAKRYMRSVTCEALQAKRSERIRPCVKEPLVSPEGITTQAISRGILTPTPMAGQGISMGSKCILGRMGKHNGQFSTPSLPHLPCVCVVRQPLASLRRVVPPRCPSTPRRNTYFEHGKCRIYVRKHCTRIPGIYDGRIVCYL